MGSRSWIDGTMEVISGLAPRPSTPNRNAASNNNIRSAPNSPARQSSGLIQRVPSHDYPGIQRAPSYDYPGISRVPSADAMERSLHNDSGHGKSTAQIIRDLKASNAHFSAKTAEMEAEFMNEINRVTRSFEEKNRSLEISLKEKTSQVTSLEARCTASEVRVREQNAQVVKLKDDNAFLRHDISELKSELTEMSKSDDKRNEWSMEKESLLLQVENLQTQVASLTQGLDTEDMDRFQQLEKSQHALTESTKKLHETQSALSSMECTSKRTVEQHAQEMSRLKKKHAEAQAEWSKSEMQLQAKIERLSSQDNPVVRDLHTQLQECDTTIASLKNKLEQSTTTISELEEQVKKTKAEATSRESYRREEAEDLRVMMDAQNEELEHLKEDLEECQREIFTKEDDLVAAEKELEDQLDRNAELKAQLDSIKAGGGGMVGGDDDHRVEELESDLQDARDAIQKLEKELDETNIKHEGIVESLRQEIDDLVADRDDAESRLAAVEEERDQAREELAISNSMVDRNVVSPSKDPADKLRSQSLEFAEKQEAMEAELKVAAETKKKLEKTQAELAAANMLLKEATEATAKARSVDTSQKEVEKLRLKVKELEGHAGQVEKTKKQLLDAQIALVALDNDRKKLAAAYREKNEEIERQHEELEVKTAATEESTSRIKELAGQVRSLEKQLQAKDAEIVEASARAVPVMNGTSSKEVGASAEEIASLKKSEAELKEALEKVRQEKEEQERQMKEKLVDRDTTISALVKSSVTNDQKLRALKSQVDSLKSGKGGDELSVGSGSRASRSISTGTAIDPTEVEKRLKTELDSYKKNLFEAELESQRLRDELEEAKSFGSSNGNLKKEMDAMAADHYEKIQERDAAIATLVKQSMAQEAHVQSLEEKLSALRSEVLTLSPSKNQGPTWEEVQRLQKESEIFAGQIIEQDEEMELLKQQLDIRETEIVGLKEELNQLKTSQVSSQADTQEVGRLRAELDEMQEANRTQLLELRDLRRKLRDKFESDKMADLQIELAQAKRSLEEQQRNRSAAPAREDTKLKMDLVTARRGRERAEKTIAEQVETIRLAQATADGLQRQLKDREQAMVDLKTEFSKSKNDALLGIQSEVDRLKEQLEEQTSRSNAAQAELEEVRKSLENSKSDRDGARDALASEVEVLRGQLKGLEDDRAHIEELKERLARAEEDRESVENSIVDSYERKMSLMKLNKDVTIDQLRKELAESKGKNVGDLDDLMNRIHQLEMENKGLSNELDAELESKNAQIHALEQTLHAQEQLVDNMRAEMDQLQSGMERTNQSRRAEIDDMQQEMLESTAKTTRQDREITALKIELEENKLQNEAKVAKLMDKIAAMDASPLARSVAEQHVDHRLEEIKGRLEQMTWRNTSLEQDNSKLRERLERSESANKVVEDDLDHMASMEEEIAFLHGKVEEIEKERDDALAAAKAALKAPAPAPAPSKPKVTKTTKTSTSKSSSSESRRSSVQSESPARRSSSRRPSFLKKSPFRSSRSSKEFAPEAGPSGNE